MCAATESSVFRLSHQFGDSGIGLPVVGHGTVRAQMYPMTHSQPVRQRIDSVESLLDEVTPPVGPLGNIIYERSSKGDEDNAP